jgi:hypothetical protein
MEIRRIGIFIYVIAERPACVSVLCSGRAVCPLEPIKAFSKDAVLLVPQNQYTSILGHGVVCLEAEADRRFAYKFPYPGAVAGNWRRKSIALLAMIALDQRTVNLPVVSSGGGGWRYCICMDPTVPSKPSSIMLVRFVFASIVDFAKTSRKLMSAYSNSLPHPDTH